MKRMKLMFGRRRMMILATLAILVLAAAALAASSASFTAQSANPGNSFTAAGFSISNEHNGTAVFNVTNMRPGGDAQQTWWVQLDPGSADGNVSLTLRNIQNPIIPSGGAALSGLLRVRVVDVTDPATPVTVVSDQLLTTAVSHGAFAISGTGTSGAWVAGERHSFEVIVTWPNGDPTVDNLRKSAQSTFDITWDGVSI